jgi:hypothetical protein
VKIIEISKRLVVLESDVKYQEYAIGEEPEFAYCKGQISILVSAPHGAAHTRNGRYKGEDEYTAAFARLIAKETGAHCIYARRKSRTDPNAALDAPYKEKVRQICKDNKIRFVIDLHGMWPKHEAGIELGTRNGKSCPEQKELIIQSLAESGFTIDNKDKLLRLRVDAQFSGNGSATREPMIKFVSEKLGIPAAQFELNAWNRIVARREDAAERDKSFRGKPEMIEKTALALIEVVKAIQEDLSR